MQRTELWTWFMHAAMQNARSSDSMPGDDRPPRGKIENAARDADDAVAQFEKRFAGMAK